MSPKNKQRREKKCPDSTPLAHPTILLPAVANAKTGTNDNPSKCNKNLYNPTNPKLKSQIAAKMDLMACIISGKN